MIIYIHGFGSHGYGSKAKVFRKYFKSIGEEFIAPSLSYVPALAIQTLEELIHSYYGDVYLIGSSLGGFYATYLSQLREVKKVVLINPAVTPDSTLKRAVGNAVNFYDESSYEWNEKHLKMLGDYKLEELNKDKFMVLLQKGDELLDYKDAQEKYKESKLIVEEGGSHSFDGIERHLETIRAFFSVGDHFKHTSKVKGVGFELDELAKRVGDLYYDDMALFLEALAQKISQDTKTDKQRGRTKLTHRLEKSASLIKQSAKEIEEAWQICKVPTVKWMIDNGFNKEMKSNFFTEIISHEFDE